MNNTSSPINTACLASNAEILAMAIILSILAVFTTVFNGLFLVTIARTPKLRTLANKISALLALTDACQGVTTIPIAAVRLYMMHRECKENEWLGLANQCTGFGLSVMSMLVMLAVALDQYSAILYPYQHARYMNAKRVFAPIFTLSAFSAFVNIVSTFLVPRLWTAYKTTVAVLLVTLFVLMVYMYSHIYIQVQKTRRQIAVTNLAEGDRIKRRAKAAKTSCLILLTLMLCYAPYEVLSIYANCCSRSISFELTEWVYMIGLSNALWDSIIYYWRLKSVRKATLSMLRRNDKLAIAQASRGTPSGT